MPAQVAHLILYQGCEVFLHVDGKGRPPPSVGLRNFPVISTSMRRGEVIEEYPSHSGIGAEAKFGFF